MQLPLRMDLCGWVTHDRTWLCLIRPGMWEGKSGVWPLQLGLPFLLLRGHGSFTSSLLSLPSLAAASRVLSVRVMRDSWMIGAPGGGVYALFSMLDFWRGSHWLFPQILGKSRIPVSLRRRTRWQESGILVCVICRSKQDILMWNASAHCMPGLPDLLSKLSQR